MLNWTKQHRSNLSHTEWIALLIEDEKPAANEDWVAYWQIEGRGPRHALFRWRSISLV